MYGSQSNHSIEWITIQRTVYAWVFGKIFMTAHIKATIVSFACIKMYEFKFFFAKKFMQINLPLFSSNDMLFMPTVTFSSCSISISSLNEFSTFSLDSCSSYNFSRTNRAWINESLSTNMQNSTTTCNPITIHFKIFVFTRKYTLLKTINLLYKNYFPNRLIIRMPEYD